MKKILIMFLLLLMVLSESIIASDVNSDPYNITKKLNVAYSYKKDLYYRFVFSDVQGGRDGTFEDIFENPGLDWITLSNLENGVLKNETPLYVNWMVDEMTPIEKLTIEITGPLVNDKNEKLDWYASIGDKAVIGGKDGYGKNNTAIVFERQSSASLEALRDSVQLKLWTENVSGKPAGNYIGIMVLNVYGEI